MSTSTDGILFYGFLIDEDSELSEKLSSLGDDIDEDDENAPLAEEPSDVVAKLYGWDGKSPQYDFEWEREHPSPITIGMHCSDSCPMYYIAIKASEVVASRGYPEKITMQVQPGWDGVLNDFFQRLYKRFQLEPPAEPVVLGWYLVSWWG
jgi:hypothetical protein